MVDIVKRSMCTMQLCIQFICIAVVGNLIIIYYFSVADFLFCVVQIILDKLCTFNCALLLQYRVSKGIRPTKILLSLAEFNR